MEFLSYSTENGVAFVTIQRPPANALSSAILKELSNLFDEMKSNEEIRVVLLHGEGRFFSAGADIKEFTTINSGEGFSNLATDGQDILEKIETYPKPVIAAIHGAALGGGLELAMSCHIRLVSEKAKLGLPELQLGIVPGFAGTQRLPRYVGTAKAAEMMFTSEPITGIEAAEYGLANHAYAEEDLMPKAKELAFKVAKKSPIALKAAIELLNYSKHENYYKGVKKEADWFGHVFVSNDAKEGISAFIEKREPVFKGK
ncbi:enoyl-CoA hydratase [Peribacillus cavernae]|uniref:Enoyl-CoA hydratase n=1 Tax=Peribacillus cavernae TaxID=1674310 RepID=A0A3S0TQJ0_9BACI|nr:enoyl-CoA hydratase [Peribacillus cavernae]MDQ0220125.1 enoyl-CoA hydratase [Peribacillus cavernae]RUQ24185.1 enoyl-CoA hydratase [Peribacillus cavernae]